MNTIISKWGNSLGIRIPVMIKDALELKAGDQVSFDLKDDGMYIRKKESTSQMFEQFYGKPFEEITQSDLGPAEIIEWGEDVGGEII